MNGVMVTYKVKTDKVSENEELVRNVYKHLQSVNHPDVHYATFKKEDGQTFVHLAFFASEEGRQILTQSEAFTAFQKDIKDRCEVPPKPEPLTEVGSYNVV